MYVVYEDKYTFQSEATPASYRYKYGNNAGDRSTPTLYHRINYDYGPWQSNVEGWEPGWVPANGWSYRIKNGEVPQQLINSAVNRLFRQFYGSESELGVFIGEARKSLGMVVNRVTWIRQLVQAIRKLNFRRVATMLRTSVKRARDICRKALRDFASVWLEISYGWLPAVNDIYAASEVLSRTFPSSLPVSSYARGSSDRVYSYDESYGRGEESVKLSFGVSCHANIRVIDPNAFLAARLGLRNPTAVAWELVPFSFVVDWFLKVGELIANLDRTIGLEIANACYSTFTNCSWNQKTLYYWDPDQLTECSCNGFIMRRELGLPSTDMVLNTWSEVFNPRLLQRGANAIALLLQALVK